MDELDRTDVEAARGLCREEDAGVALDLAGDDDLLLIPARQRGGAGRRTAAAYVERMQEPPRPGDQPLREAASRSAESGSSL